MGHGSNVGTQTGSADVIERGSQCLGRDGGNDGGQIADRPLSVSLPEGHGADRCGNNVGRKGRKVSFDRLGQRQVMIGSRGPHRDGISHGIRQKSDGEISERRCPPGIGDGRCEGTSLRPALKPTLLGRLKCIGKLGNLPEFFGPSLD